jgi:hypothetical protein
LAKVGEPEDGLTPDAILLAADNAELASKRAGKNCLTAAPAIHPVV